MREKSFNISHLIGIFFLFMATYILTVFHFIGRKTFATRLARPIQDRHILNQSLLLASEKGSVWMIEKCLTQGADVNTCDAISQNTPLILATQKGHSAGVALLVQAGADIDRVNRHGITALMYTVFKNHYAIFRYLFFHRANLLLRSTQGYSIIQWAIVHDRIDILAFLISHKIPLNHFRQENGNTPLLTAVAAGKLPIVKLLLEHGSQLDEINAKNESALTLAIRFQYTDIQQYLSMQLQQGVKIYNAKTSQMQSIKEIRLQLAQLYYEHKKSCLHMDDKLASGELLILPLKVTSSKVPIDQETENPKKKKGKALFRKKAEPAAIPHNKTIPLPSSSSSARIHKAIASHKQDKSSSTVQKTLQTVLPTTRERDTFSNVFDGAGPQTITPYKEGLKIEADTQENAEPIKDALIPAPFNNRTGKLEKTRHLTKSVLTLSTLVLPKPIDDILAKLSHISSKTYLVGGCVRDALLGRSPTDFDMITQLSLETVQKILNLGFISKHIANLYRIDLEDFSIDILCDPSFELLRDARKRDFTCNALYVDVNHELYDPLKCGLKHIRQKNMVTIQEANVSFKDDPIRLLRLARLVGQYSFTLDQRLVKEVKTNACYITQCEAKRLQYELRKVFLRGHATANFFALKSLKLLCPIFSTVNPRDLQNEHWNNWVEAQLKQTDQLVLLKQPASLAYIYAIFQVAGYIAYHPQPEATGQPLPTTHQIPDSFAFFNKVDAMSKQLIAAFSKPMPTL